MDAVSTDDVILTGMIIQDDTLELKGEGYTVEPYGAGIADGDAEFKEFVDGVVQAFIDDGRWAADVREVDRAVHGRDRSASDDDPRGGARAASVRGDLLIEAIASR